MGLIEKLFNKLGYYKYVPSKYYTTNIDNRKFLVNEEEWKNINTFDRKEVEKATRHLLVAMGQDVNRPRIVGNT